jgi:hypothetical protein
MLRIARSAYLNRWDVPIGGILIDVSLEMKASINY